MSLGQMRSFGAERKRIQPSRVDSRKEGCRRGYSQQNRGLFQFSGQTIAFIDLPVDGQEIPNHTDEKQTAGKEIKQTGTPFAEVKAVGT